MTSLSKITLPWPTNRTTHGPRLIHEKESLVVEYDYEQDNGESRWSRVTFQKPLFVEYRDIACCRDPGLIESKAIRCLDTSLLLAEVMTAWQESVGWQEWQKKNVANKIRQYTLFFDDVGCLNVVGSDCFVEDVPSLAEKPISESQPMKFEGVTGEPADKIPRAAVCDAPLRDPVK